MARQQESLPLLCHATQSWRAGCLCWSLRALKEGRAVCSSMKPFIGESMSLLHFALEDFELYSTFL